MTFPPANGQSARTCPPLAPGLEKSVDAGHRDESEAALPAQWLRGAGAAGGLFAGEWFLS